MFSLPSSPFSKAAPTKEEGAHIKLKSHWNSLRGQKKKIKTAVKSMEELHHWKSE